MKDGLDMLIVNDTGIKRSRKLMTMRVMLVDDNELSRQYQKACLLRLGIVCETAENSTSAICMLRKAYMRDEGYDICLVNWYMPRAGEFIQEIRTIFSPERMMIVCSISKKEQNRKKITAAGADYFIERPFQQHQMYRFFADRCKEGQRKKAE